jgi:hypothetical protein
MWKSIQQVGGERNSPKEEQKMKKKRYGWMAMVIAVLFFFSPGSSAAALKVYWHFTVKAFVDLPDTNGVEWAWVTMVEYDAPRAYPAEAGVAAEYGGELKGTVFAFVRGAAWRSSHRYFRDASCSGRPSKSETFWESSDSDSVFAMGQLISSQPFRGLPGTVPPEPDSFRFGFTKRRILRPDGTWFEPESRVNIFTGAINVEGSPREETRGDFTLQVVNYSDNLEHHRRCGKAWAEQYLTAFRTFHIVDSIPAFGDYVFGQKSLHTGSRKRFVYHVERSSSPKHPRWKQQTM